ncbi:MAG: GNAT family N-acetyltransferase [Betaproteobacteria bacterium]|nr:GNAT family N-acetyltransferase [Betaproteobacteria bacterium]
MDALHKLKLRRLAAADLDAVVALDAELAGRTRRAYFERRLAAALRQPELHLQFAAEHEGAFLGHALARVLEGEFGRTQPGLRLEVISVAPAAQSRGVGSALHRALEDEAGKRGITELRTTVSWRDHAMLRFLDSAGYALSASLVLDCALRDNPLLARPEAVGASERQSPGDANDWSAPAGDNFAQLARDAADVRLLAAKDLEDVVRIDRQITGRERRAFMQHALDEALRESGVRISLAARAERVMTGYLMARADLGDFGRTEPVAVIDTLGVAPEFAHRGIGHALLQQLFLNLDALRIERVETIVSTRSPDLLGFFYGAGFAHAQRLAFVKRLP